jgi:secretion/DNA translocation related TadE-like protein
VLAVGIASVSIVCVTATGAIGHATAMRTGLAAAADAAALAGADALAGFVADDPCTVAARAAELNAARLESCTVSGSDVAVVVGTTVLGVTVTSRARAGPPPG